MEVSAEAAVMIASSSGMAVKDAIAGSTSTIFCVCNNYFFNSISILTVEFRELKLYYNNWLSEREIGGPEKILIMKSKRATDKGISKNIPVSKQSISTPESVLATKAKSPITTVAKPSKSRQQNHRKQNSDAQQISGKNGTSKLAKNLKQREMGSPRGSMFNDISSIMDVAGQEEILVDD